MIKTLTLTIIVSDGRILLGMKKRGFGAGKWNGFGGKVQSGESLTEAAKRECREETGIVPRTIQEAGILNFVLADATELAVHVFFVTSFTGKATETEEMKPKWFALDEIPYAHMWADDKYWLPLVLAGKKVTGTFEFDDSYAILRYTIHEL